MLRAVFLLALLLSLAACDSNSGDPMGNEIRRVFVSEIEIESAPLQRPNGDDWDSNLFGIDNAPDIYFDLVNDDTGAISESTFGDDFANVVSQDFPLLWLFEPELEFTRFSTPFAFEIWDSDDINDRGDSDFMGITEAFSMQQIIDAGAPTLFTVRSLDGSISVRIRLRYTS